MTSSSFFLKLCMIGVAVAIGFLFIEPSISRIKNIQDATTLYEVEYTKVAKVNSDLAEKVMNMNSVSPDQIEDLTNYFPRYIDDITITKDLTIIAEQSGVTLVSVGFTPATEEEVQNSSTETEMQFDEFGIPIEVMEPIDIKPAYFEHSFAVKVDGNYDDIKAFLDLLSKNHYPLAVKLVTLSLGENDILSGEFQIAAYSELASPLAAGGSNE